jgi:hypothetical protein
MELWAYVVVGSCWIVAGWCLWAATEGVRNARYQRRLERVIERILQQRGHDR